MRGGLFASLTIFRLTSSSLTAGPHLLAVTHASDVISLMRPFLERHTPSSLPPYVPIDSHSALRTVAKIAGDPKIANRNPHNPESFSMVTAEERAQAAKNLEEMERVEQTCELDLPMRFEREDWEPLRPGEDPEHDTRWTYVSPFPLQSILPRSPCSFSFLLLLQVVDARVLRSSFLPPLLRPLLHLRTRRRHR